MVTERMLWIVSGDVSSDTLGLVSKTNTLAAEQDMGCCAVLVAPNLSQQEQKQLSAAGADYILHLPVDPMRYGSEQTVCEVLARLTQERKPEAIFFLSSLFFGTVAPAVAAVLETGITADCTELRWDEKETLLQSRPTFGGRTLATIRTKTFPVIATVRGGIFRNTDAISGRMAEIERVELIPHIPNVPIQRLETGKNSTINLRQAKIIFAGGAGMGSKTAFQRLYQLAERTGGQVAASRGAVAAGYANYALQVGQTGATVRPKIYVAFGISGAVQHLSGMIDAACIVAVNPDRNAPIHSVSDYSVYADAEQVISDLLEYL